MNADFRVRKRRGERPKRELSSAIFFAGGQGASRRGKFGPLNEWMRKNIWSHSCCLTAGELAKRILSSSLGACLFLKYLDEKYSSIYGLTPQ